ncbi:E3 ubiquitin-protein ligase RING1 [Camellia lanceoleosa]|uniref:E3 ubiquitin-protein ligase RING1 n=1 Tax=Camellia lanceoleosa TaxID=1840588 RepID=A0ACC0INZ7_9ERIC|nr:E3 ubiquitin-protein ligase RING1 [Camellia lanceoleosa]
MSSTTTTDAAAAVERQTYWCHECDMSVSLISSSSSATATATTSSSLLCPHCHSDFLEEMDSPHLFDPNPNPNPNPSLSSFLDPPFPNLSPHQSPPPTTPIPTLTTAPDDNYLLDSPYLHRLIQHLTNSESDNPFPTTTTTAATRYHSPASKSAVESIPTIKITAAFLDLDPINLCAVCKDQFVIDVEAKQLPCKHMYHSDWILPGVAQHIRVPCAGFSLRGRAMSPRIGGDRGSLR